MGLLLFLILIALLFGAGVAIKLAFWGFLILIALALLGGYAILPRRQGDMSLTQKRIAVVGSREFTNYKQLEYYLAGYIDHDDDELVSGGAIGADSMAQRFAKEQGFDIRIKYPKYRLFGAPATFIRNEKIVEDSDLVVAFYAKGRFQQGGTSNSAKWARQLDKPLYEFEEE